MQCIAKWPWFLSQLAGAKERKIQAIQLGALTALLSQVANNSNPTTQNCAAEGVKVLMTGVVDGDGAGDVIRARAQAIPQLIKVLEGDLAARVRDKLKAALNAFSPGGAEKVQLALESDGFGV
jgi:hypothetical protein